MKKCPVCNNQLPELIPEFCDVCGWDVGEDLTLQPILNMPDEEDIARYKRRLENAKKIWEKKLEKESLLEKKLQEVEKEKTQTIVIPEQMVISQKNTNDNMIFVEGILIATKTVVITNDTGIHTRPGNKFTSEAKKFESKVTLHANGKEVNGKSLLKLLSLGAKKGTEVTVITEGSDADIACQKLADALANLKD